MQRQNSLRDAAILEQSMQIILSHAHDVLNKRKHLTPFASICVLLMVCSFLGGIMTSYQMKMAPQVNAQEQQENKDPLNELDALWKMK